MVTCIAGSTILAKRKTSIIANLGYIEQGTDEVRVSITSQVPPTTSNTKSASTTDSVSGSNIIRNKNSLHVLDICYLNQTSTEPLMNSMKEPILVYGGNSGILIIQQMNLDCMLHG